MNDVRGDPEGELLPVRGGLRNERDVVQAER